MNSAQGTHETSSNRPNQHTHLGVSEKKRRGGKEMERKRMGETEWEGGGGSNEVREAGRERN